MKGKTTHRRFEEEVWEFVEYVGGGIYKNGVTLGGISTRPKGESGHFRGDLTKRDQLIKNQGGPNFKLSAYRGGERPG